MFGSAFLLTDAIPYGIIAYGASLCRAVDAASQSSRKRLRLGWLAVGPDTVFVTFLLLGGLFMAQLNPTQAAANWRKGMAASGDKFKAGVQAVTESPTAKAAMAIDRQVQGVIAAAQSGKTQRALNAVTLESWKNDMINKGATRISTGAATAEPKVAQFMNEFFPHLQAGIAQLPPRGDLEQNLQRAAAMARHNAAFQRR